MFLRAAFLLMLCAANASSAAGAEGAASFETSGYVKNLYKKSASSLDGARFWSDVSRVRLGLDASVFSLRAHADYDHEAHAGTFLKSREYLLSGFGEPATHFPMEQTIRSGADGLYRHRLYRGWVEAKSRGASLRFGRQRIAWGTGKIWNPTDFLNPYSPTSVERDERRGIDSVYLRKGIGVYGQSEAVYGIGGRWSETDLLGRVRGHLGRVDASLSGGKVAGSSASWTLGGDWSADLGGGNFHGEWSYTELKFRAPFWKAMAGYEYSFPADPELGWLKDLWLVAEYFHNGIGETDPARHDKTILLSGREVTLGRDYAGVGLKKELHPLVEAQVYHIANLGDRSYYFGPSVSWNAVSELHLSAGWQMFGGGRLSEYGALPNSAYLQAQYFF